MSRFAYTAIALSIAAAAGCGPARTSAATQATIKAFDASKSDPKAIAIADEVLTALGGEANWAKAKEIGWTQMIIVDGKVVDVATHIWDRWNARHHFEHLEAKGQWDVTMYEMFGGYSYAYFENPAAKENKIANAMKDEKQRLVADAQKRYDRDVYRVMLPYKLKDPGVKLSYAEELPEEGSPKGSPMKYDEIKITFEAGVGPTPGDTWYLMVDKATHLPSVIEHVATGKPDNEREGIKLDNWKDAGGGLKLATMQTTLGYTKPDAPKVPVELPEEWKKQLGGDVAGLQAPKPGEIVILSDLKVLDTVNEDNFIPAVE